MSTYPNTQTTAVISVMITNLGRNLDQVKSLCVMFLYTKCTQKTKLLILSKFINKFPGKGRSHKVIMTEASRQF